MHKKSLLLIAAVSMTFPAMVVRADTISLPVTPIKATGNSITLSCSKQFPQEGTSDFIRVNVSHIEQNERLVISQTSATKKTMWGKFKAMNVSTNLIMSQPKYKKMKNANGVVLSIPVYSKTPISLSYVAKLVTANGKTLYSSQPLMIEWQRSAPKLVLRQIIEHLNHDQTVFFVSVPAETTTKLAITDFSQALQNDPFAYLQVRKITVTDIARTKMKYHVFFRETPAQQIAVNQQIQSVLSHIIKPKMDVYAKENAINTYMVKQVKYDETEAHVTAYDALFKREATCNGFSWLTHLMLNAVEIRNDVVIGQANGGSHSWNEVDLKDKWYMLDTTWDNTSGNRYQYFNLTSSQLAKTHTWNHSGLPVANTNFIAILKHLKIPSV